MERAAPKFDPTICPHCGSQQIEALAYQNGIRRYNCRRCDRNYCAIVAASRFGDPVGAPVARIPDDSTIIGNEPARRGLDASMYLDSKFTKTALKVVRQKEANMAVPTVCGKCHKEFSSKHYVKKHENKCKGASSDAAEPTESNGNGDPVVRILKAERQKIADRILSESPEIQKLDLAIETIERRPT